MSLPTSAWYQECERSEILTSHIALFHCLRGHSGTAELLPYPHGGKMRLGKGIRIYSET